MRVGPGRPPCAGAEPAGRSTSHATELAAAYATELAAAHAADRAGGAVPVSSVTSTPLRDADPPGMTFA